MSTGSTRTLNYVDNPVADVAGNSAYVGFTGGTGNGTSTQSISNFSFVVPEPTTISMFGVGALALMVLAIRRRSYPR